MKKLWISLFFSFVLPLAAQSPVALAFKPSDQPGTFLAGSGKEAAIVEDGVLRLDGVNVEYRFKKKFPVRENARYKLELEVRSEGEDTVEKNFRVPDMLNLSRTALFPRWNTWFYGKDGKVIVRREILPGMSIVNGGWKVCTDIFYAPPGAESMELVFRLPKNRNPIAVRKITFSAIPDDDVVNCNPDFNYGYAGWENIANGGILLIDKDGGPLLDTGYGSTSEYFPLLREGCYELYARGAPGKGGYRDLNIRQYDKQGKVIRTVSLNAAPEGKSVYFVKEKDAEKGKFVVYNHLLKEVRLKYMGDASKIEELRVLQKKQSKK